MCTLSIIPTVDQRVRLAFNRDENPQRAAGLPPTLQRFGERTAICPIDPVSGGTWLAANDAGLALALLNVYSSEGRPNPGRHSRGTIIPALLESDSLVMALDVANDFDFAEFSPFRLVIAELGLVASLKWDGRETEITSRLLGTPELFTSSGLGDHIVDGPRRALFTELLTDSPTRWPHAQDTFHSHRWPGREHLSVNMLRPTARTVSFATIELSAESVTFSYHPVAPDQSAERTTLRLPVAPALPCT